MEPYFFKNIIVAYNNINYTQINYLKNNMNSISNLINRKSQISF